SCQVPIAGYATISDQKEIEFTGLIMTPDGKERFEFTSTGTDPVELGKLVSNKLKEQGAYDIIKRLNEQQ
ncbi:hydroxymethylbilane synthase, partial [Staphylococcus aureus]